MGKSMDTEEVRSLYEAILSLKNIDECFCFFEDLCTANEILAMSSRYEVAKLLTMNKTFNEISQKTGASTATISRVNRSLKFGKDGYAMVMKRTGEL